MSAQTFTTPAGIASRQRAGEGLTAITMPTAEAITANRVAARLAEPAPESADEPERLRQHAASMALMRQRAVEDAAELEAFAETCAEFFDCPALLDPGNRMRIRQSFLDLRHIARQRNAEAVRRAADPTATGREAAAPVPEAIARQQPRTPGDGG